MKIVLNLVPKTEKNIIPFLALFRHPNSMAYINGNGSSYNMGILSNFLKSEFGTKWDSILEKGITNIKTPQYDLLITNSKPLNPFSKFDLKRNPNTSIKDIEAILSRVTNKY